MIVKEARFKRVYGCGESKVPGTYGGTVGGKRSAEVCNLQSNHEKIIGVVRDVDEGLDRREVEVLPSRKQKDLLNQKTFDRIANRLDGKLVMQHYLTEEGASFSVARIIIDYYQWEPIQEWIAVKCDDVQFQVYVKEFGGDVLSIQVHPKESSKPPRSCSTCRSVEAMEIMSENSTEVEETVMMLVGDKAYVDAEPLIEDVLNANLVSEQGCMGKVVVAWTDKGREVGGLSRG
ncbi:hypothetical protein PIB30_074238 [Stylosanthes scabra]|uniref:Uncharacterized protein n=1 Tax=Stylosanthes scabra TaxID=79078 RepID=A0ABU6WMU2_9FABA|nr:hypothetical protein [Stylosanthes scabra]